MLAAHENPDGDALGSLVAMQGLLTALGKDSAMFISPADLPLPREYRFFSLDGLIREPPADIAQRTVVFLDCGNIDRNSASVLRDGAHLLNIDHHHDNTRFGTLNHVVARRFVHGRDRVGPDARARRAARRPTVAEALYVGLITDTGRFMYESTGPRAHRMAAELIEAGVDVPDVYRRLYEGVPLGKLALLALALGQIQRFDSGELALAAITAEDFDRAEAEESYSEGIIDQLRALRRDEGRGARARALAAERARASTKSRCARPTTRSMSRSSRAHRAAADTAAPPASRRRSSRTSWSAFLREALAAQLHPSSDGHAAPTLA